MKNEKMTAEARGYRIKRLETRLAAIERALNTTKGSKGPASRLFTATINEYRALVAASK